MSDDFLPEFEALPTDELLLQVPRWDLEEVNRLYVKLQHRDTAIRYLANPDVIPIKVTNSETDGLAGWLAKDQEDNSIGLVEVVSTPIFDFFTQAYGLAPPPDGNRFFALYAGYPGQYRANYSRLLQKIQKVSSYQGPNIRISCNPFIMTMDNRLRLTLGVWKEPPFGKSVEQDNIHHFNFPGWGQNHEFEQAHKWLDDLVKEKEEMMERRQKADTRKAGRRGHTEGGFQVPPARGGRHYW
jgi:hypothetical protein